jgi:hypothetical protein
MRLERRRLKVEHWAVSSSDGDMMADGEVDTTGSRGTKNTALAADDISSDVIDVER